MKTDMKSEMHNLGYRPPLHISTVTSHCVADSILGKISETSLNIPAQWENLHKRILFLDTWVPQNHDHLFSWPSMYTSTQVLDHC
jgi:hypothetical protein